MKHVSYAGVIISSCGVLFPMVMMGCNSESIHKAVPAHIINATDASRSELNQVVSSALHLKNILLARDALTTNSVLIIENKQSIGSGYGIQKPKVFRLKKSGMHCVLEYQVTNKRWVLKVTQCVPVANQVK